MKKRISNLLPYLLLGFLTLFFCWLFAGRHGIFGAKVDWISQHSVLPEYFRQQFYETGDLFPEFAPNLGGGQNIFHFSYYGLYSPVFLLSYLLPFVPMGHYLMAASIAELILAVCLFYYWLRQKNFSRDVAFWVSVMFVLAGPMIYHACHQVMFVSYLPFLCMALLGVDRYWKEKRSGLYLLGTFLMILSSFYYSVGGMLVLLFYGFSEYLKQKQTIRLVPLCKDGLYFLLLMATAILMSGFLLLPTACSLLGNRESAKNVDLAALFTPQIPTDSLLYHPYGVGLSTLVLTVLLAGFAYGKWQDRVLNAGCALMFLFPFFAWALNGGLYVRGKSLIPFLPLLGYLIAEYLEKQKRRELPFWMPFLAHLLTLALLYGCFQELEEWRLILADGILMFACFLIFWKSGRMFWLMAPPTLCLFLFGYFSGHLWELEDPKIYAETTDQNIQTLISQTLDKEPQLVRLEQRGPEGEKGSDLNRIWDSRQWISSLYSSASHADYRKFWRTAFPIEQPFRNHLIQASSNNPLYQKLMGIQYLVTRKADKTLTVSQNKNAAPILYATDRVLSEQDFYTLTFPYNQIALMKYAVVKNAPDNDGHWKSEITSWAKPAKLSVSQITAKKTKITRATNGSYHIQAQENTAATARIQSQAQPQDTLLYLQFHIKNNRPNRDVSVWVGSTRNRLSARSHIYYNGNTTFTYVLDLGEKKRTVKLTFGEGDYEISDIKCFLGDKRVLKEETDNKQKLYQAKFQADRSRTKGNTIQGRIPVKKTGWLITSIPYDSHFEVLVDGEPVKAEKVNTVFLGFAIEKGKRKITITYHAPGAKAGRVVTCVGILLCLIRFADSKRRCESYPL